jgi:ribosomal protein S19E (S16A)
MQHIEVISGEVLNFLDDGELKTVHMITRHFRSAGHFLVHILDYFRDKGLIDKASQTVRLTPKSRPNLEEVAYIVIKDGFSMM